MSGNKNFWIVRYMRMRKYTQSGFTFVELFITMAIVAIMARQERERQKHEANLSKTAPG